MILNKPVIYYLLSTTLKNNYWPYFPQSCKIVWLFASIFRMINSWQELKFIVWRNRFITLLFSCCQAAEVFTPWLLTKDFIFSFIYLVKSFAPFIECCMKKNINQTVEVWTPWLSGNDWTIFCVFIYLFVHSKIIVIVDMRKVVLQERVKNAGVQLFTKEYCQNLDLTTI